MKTPTNREHLLAAVGGYLQEGLDIREIEREAARSAYEILFNTVCGGNQCRVAERLGVHRNTVARQIAELGLVFARVGRRRMLVRGTWTRDKGEGNREQGPGTREQGAGSRDQGTERQRSAVSHQLKARG
jgi:hypothetical protein